MPTDPQPDLSVSPTSAEPGPIKSNLVAPIWHTIVVVALVLGNSLWTAWFTSQVGPKSVAVTENARIVQYAATIFLELFLLLVVWIGLRLKQTKLRELIGGRWDNVEAFLLDVAIAIAFWVVAYGTIVGLSYAFGLAKASQIGEAKKLAGMLAPHTWLGLLIFIALSNVAGFVEEVLFRGYLQRQITAISGNIYVGLIVSAVIFGAGHGYEGSRRMVLIVILGLMFGLLARWCKSLRPGMIGHAFFDSFQGVLLFVATRLGILSGQ